MGAVGAAQETTTTGAAQEETTRMEEWNRIAGVAQKSSSVTDACNVRIYGRRPGGDESGGKVESHCGIGPKQQRHDGCLCERTDAPKAP